MDAIGAPQPRRWLTLNPLTPACLIAACPHPDLISSDKQPRLLPLPDSIRSLPNSQDPPASCSNQAGEEGSPTQASESAAPSAGTVTSSGGEEGTPVHEISGGNSPKPAHGEDRKKKLH